MVVSNNLKWQFCQISQKVLRVIKERSHASSPSPLHTCFQTGKPTERPKLMLISSVWWNALKTAPWSQGQTRLPPQPPNTISASVPVGSESGFWGHVTTFISIPGPLQKRKEKKRVSRPLKSRARERSLTLHNGARPTTIHARVFVALFHFASCDWLYLLEICRFYPPRGW